MYVTSEGLILIDDKYERDHDNIAAEIKNISSLRVKYIFTTHYHEDHSGGNAKMMAGGAEVISTKMTRDNIVRKAQSNVVINPTPARAMTFSPFAAAAAMTARVYGSDPARVPAQPGTEVLPICSNRIFGA